jgi:hypothetical protein
MNFTSDPHTKDNSEKLETPKGERVGMSKTERFLRLSHQCLVSIAPLVPLIIALFGGGSSC